MAAVAVAVLSAVDPTVAATTPVGTAYAWHDNDAGQLGIGSYVNSNTPVASHLPPGTTCIAVAGGQSESLYVTSTGAVFATGYAHRGQLGDNSTVNVTSPVQTSIPSGVRIKSVAAGWDDAFALTTTGAVYSWGWNIYGQLGVGTTGNQSAVPLLVHMPAGVKIKAIAAGKYHVLALTSTGSIYAWGSNAFGQLGDSNTADSNLPVQVELPSGITATAIGAGDGHSLAVTSTGSIYAWGENDYGQLGDGTTTARSVPVLVQLPSGVVAKTVTAGGVSPTARIVTGDYSMAMSGNGHVYAWGSNANGQLGNGTTTSSLVPVAVKLPAGVEARAISSASNYGWALTRTGSIYSWGFDAGPLPVATVLPPGLSAVSIGVGPDAEQVLALLA